MEEVTISIVNYGQKDLLRRCLSQLESLCLPPCWETIVVDNNSHDASAEMVAKRFPWVKLISLRYNIGFGGGHNEAYSQSNNAVFVVLNPDVSVLPGSLESLLNAFQEFSNAAIIGPCLLNPDYTVQHSARRFYTWRTVICRRIRLPGWKKLNDHHLMKDRDPMESQKVNWVLGACMAVRRSAFGEAQLFDTRYRLYFEDVDICYFAQKRGWDVIYYPKSKMIHDHQRESAQQIVNRLTVRHLMSWFKFYFKTKTYTDM